MLINDYEDGIAAYERKDYATVLIKFRSAALQGNATAQTILGPNMKGNRCIYTWISSHQNGDGHRDFVEKKGEFYFLGIEVL